MGQKLAQPENHRLFHFHEIATFPYEKPPWFLHGALYGQTFTSRGRRINRSKEDSTDVILFDEVIAGAPFPGPVDPVGTVGPQAPWHGMAHHQLLPAPRRRS